MNIKRISLSLIAIAMVSLLVSAASFALFSAQSANQGNTFTTGTVTLGAPLPTIYDVTNIAPGDSGSQPFHIVYTGSLDAWIGIDASLSGALTTCDGGGRFTAGLVDAAGTSYSVNAVDQVAGVFVQNQALDLTLNWGLALAAGNDCQAKSAQVSLLIKAVQYKNNINGAGPISWN